MKEIILSQGKVALVDDEDYGELAQHKWFANKRCNTFYALRNKWDNGKHSIVFMHREILGLKKGDGKITDHRDGNGLNNQRENIRNIPNHLNVYNRSKVNKNNTSGYRGISWNKNAKKWVVNVCIHGLNIYCGIYQNITDAIQVYNKEIVKYRGQDAILNFP